jgi:hypothetical protein
VELDEILSAAERLQARARRDEWHGLRRCADSVRAGPCAQGRVVIAQLGALGPAGRPVRAGTSGRRGRLLKLERGQARARRDEWTSRRGARGGITAGPCAQGRVGPRRSGRVSDAGRPVRAGTSGPRCKTQGRRDRQARARRDEWTCAPSYPQSPRAGPCAQGRVAVDAQRPSNVRGRPVRAGTSGKPATGAFLGQRQARARRDEWKACDGCLSWAAAGPCAQGRVDDRACAHGSSDGRPVRAGTSGSATGVGGSRPRQARARRDEWTRRRLRGEASEAGPCAQGRVIRTRLHHRRPAAGPCAPVVALEGRMVSFAACRLPLLPSFSG